MTKVRSAVVWLLGVLLAVSLICAVTTVHRASAAEEQTADNTYLIPIDGYAGTDRKAKDGGLSLWFTTNFGRGKEGVWQGLAEYSILTSGRRSAATMRRNSSYCRTCATISSLTERPCRN